MKGLGYELHVRFVWDKENGVAPAFTATTLNLSCVETSNDKS